MEKAASRELVTVATFGEPMEAHLCCQWLVSQGMDASLADLYTSATYWLYNNAIGGGAKVQVPDCQAQRARDLIQQHRRNRQPREPEFAEPVPEPASARVNLLCPCCDSCDVEIAPSRHRFLWYIVIALWFGVPVLLVTHFFWGLGLAGALVLLWLGQGKCCRCQNCGYEWTARRSRVPT